MLVFFTQKSGGECVNGHLFQIYKYKMTYNINNIGVNNLLCIEIENCFEKLTNIFSLAQSCVTHGKLSKKVVHNFNGLKEGT